MPALWAAGLLLRRLRTERGILLLIFVLVAATSFVFAAGPRLLNRVSDDALRYAARVAPEAQRNLALTQTSGFAPGPEGGVSGIRGRGDRLAAQFPASVAALISDRSLRITTVRFYVPEPPIYTTHITLRYQDGLQDATRLVAGRWPVDRGVPLRQDDPGDADDPDDGAPVEPVILEAALSTASAAEIGVKAGDRLGVTLDGTDPLVRGVPFQITGTEIEVVGLYEPLDPTTAYWLNNDPLLEASQEGSDDNPVAFATAYIPAEMYPTLGARGLPFHNEWRYTIDPDRLDAGQVEQLQVDLRRLGLTTGAASAADPGSVAYVTGLPGILDRYATELSLTESILSIAAIGPFALAGGAMAMVAFLLVGRRRATLALTRGRGASSSLVLGTQLWESILLAGGGTLVGLLAAVLAIDSRASPLSATLSIAVAVVAVLLLVGASWSTARRPLGQLERDDPPVFRVAPRRLVIELTIVVIAVAATLLLRQRGLTVGAPGTAARFDPLLASVPVLGGLAAGIVALRLYPLPIRALGWLAARRRDIVPVLGLRTIGRHPAAANLPLLVLLLTAASGAFASVIASSLDRGQVVASYLNTGADYRIEKIGSGALDPALHIPQIPGVESVAPGLIDNSAAFANGPYQGSSIHLESVDPLAYEDVVGGSAADPHWPAPFLDEPPTTGAGTTTAPIPAILSRSLPVGTGDPKPGDTFRMRIAGQSLTFQLIEQRPDFPGIDSRLPFAVVPFNWVGAAVENGPLPASVLWVRAPADVKETLVSTIAEVRARARVISRHDAYAALHDAPLVGVIAAGYRLALFIAAGYMALTIIGALVLSGARRTRDLAFLRTLGVSAPQALALTVMEHAPPVLLALTPGVALGIAIAILCEPGLGLATFVGTSGVPLFVDWPSLALMTGALIAVAAVAVAGGTWLSRRGRMVDALRIGDD